MYSLKKSRLNRFECLPNRVKSYWSTRLSSGHLREKLGDWMLDHKEKAFGDSYWE